MTLFSRLALTYVIFRMVMRGDIPYLRIPRTIPREMRDKLPQEYLSLLETTVWSHGFEVFHRRSISDKSKEVTKSRTFPQGSVGIDSLLPSQIWRSIPSFEHSPSALSIHQKTYTSKYNQPFLEHGVLC